MTEKKNPLDSIKSKLRSLVKKSGKYAAFIFILVLLGMYSFLVLRINSLTSGEPSDEAVSEKLQTVSRPKIDKAAVEKIQQLQDNSVQVQSLFQAARDNPFHE